MLVPSLAGALPEKSSEAAVDPGQSLVFDGTEAAVSGGQITSYPVLFSDQFSDFANWDASYYVTTPWVVSGDYIYTSAPTAAELIAYQNDEDSLLIMANPLDLSDARSPLLQWQMAYHTQEDCDFLLAGVEYFDGTDWAVDYLGEWSGTQIPHGTFDLDLSPYAGLSDVYVFFEFVSDESDVVEGVSIDDLYVYETNPNAPVANNDAYTMSADAVLDIAADGVLANDTDADGDTLEAYLIDEPANGTVALNVDGSFTYTPELGFVGPDYFTYVAYDGAGDSQVATVQITVGTGITIEDNAAGVTFDRFVPSVGAAYSGDSYIYGRWTGTRLESRFTGTKIAWYGPKQPSYGMADVYVDNVKVATVDCYAPAGSATVNAKIWESGTLSAGTHTLSIRLVGQKNAASTGNFVVVDKLTIPVAGAANPQTRANETAGTFTGSWVNCANASYTNGTYRYSRWAGAKIRYTFTGTKVAWVGPRALNYGRADVYIDGVKKATVSQYGVLGWRYRVWESSALTAGSHTIEIRVLGTKEAASSNTIVVVDGFDVTP